MFSNAPRMDTPTSILLTVEVGPDVGMEYLFPAKSSFLVGRDGGCDLVLRARGVSSRHCRFSCITNGWAIIDLGSTNGVYLNRVKLKSGRNDQASRAEVIHDGDLIQIGEVVFRVGFEKIGREKTELLGPLGLPSERVNEDPPAEGVRSNPELPWKPERTLVVGNESSTLAISPNAVPSSNLRDSVTASDNLGETQLESLREVSDYQLLRRIGTGGMGEVWLARNKVRNEPERAIKLLRNTNHQNKVQSRDRFMREMTITRAMQHPFLIRCIDCGEVDGELFIVMEYCDQGNLANLLAKSGPLTVRRAIRLMDRLLSGLDYAHSQEIVHRDLKPSNILLQRVQKAKYIPKIGDFGLAKNYLGAGTSGMTTQGTVGGSWNYMSREQLTDFRFVSPRGDVWSMAAMFFETLTLQLPRSIPPGANAIRTILETKPLSLGAVLPDAHPELVRFVDQCLDLQPENRFENAGEMRKALSHVAETLGVQV
jgi:serine/threonine protein kinase